VSFTPIKNTADAIARVGRAEQDFVKVGVFDLDGVFRGKFMHRGKFLNALQNNFGFCDVVLGWDMNDQLYDNSTYTGWHTGFPDARVRIVPETGRQLPTEDNCWLFIGEFVGDAALLCPRGVLQRVLARAADAGFRVKAGFEYEFFVFAETPDSVRAKHHQDLVPVAPSNTGYSMLRQTSLSTFYRDLLKLCSAMDMPLEGLHEEMGAGVMEAALIANDGLKAADQAALFKTYTKAHLQQHGMIATFMAKWSEKEAGQSGHIHLSLTDPEGTGTAFHDNSAEGPISDTMRHFIGGQLAMMREFTALFAPTVNSYRRLVPGLWAPTSASWGIDNRTCALRAIPGAVKDIRVEHRLPGADTNPYLALAAAIASGLHGIENTIDPGEPILGNAYDLDLAFEQQLPRTLEDAGGLLGKSRVARDWFGDTFVDHFVASRDWEVREARKHVSDWELSRYFELI
jgi:glutamine synthetase